MSIGRWVVGGLRFAAALMAYLVSLTVAYGVFLPSAPAASAAGEPMSPGTALLVVAVLNTTVMTWLIVRSRVHGWRLAGTMIALLFGVQTLQSQVESLAFQAVPAFRGHLPLAIIPRIVLAGLVHALLWIPVAVLVLGRWNGGPPARDPGGEESARSRGWAWRWLVAALAYVVLYFTFGYYVAWRNPAVIAYYQGTDSGAFWPQMRATVRDLPWLPPFQVLRGLVWTALGVLAVRTMRASAIEKALAVGALFSVVMNASLLIPNPYMPPEVRMAHLAETASSNLIFGLLVGGLFARTGVGSPRLD